MPRSKRQVIQGARHDWHLSFDSKIIRGAYLSCFGNLQASLFPVPVLIFQVFKDPRSSSVVEPLKAAVRSGLSPKHRHAKTVLMNEDRRPGVLRSSIYPPGRLKLHSYSSMPDTYIITHCNEQLLCTILPEPPIRFPESSATARHERNDSGRRTWRRTSDLAPYIFTVSFSTRDAVLI